MWSNPLLQYTTFRNTHFIRYILIFHKKFLSILLPLKFLNKKKRTIKSIYMKKEGEKIDILWGKKYQRCIFILEYKDDI